MRQRAGTSSSTLQLQALSAVAEKHCLILSSVVIRENRDKPTAVTHPSCQKLAYDYTVFRACRAHSDWYLVRMPDHLAGIVDIDQLSQQLPRRLMAVAGDGFCRSAAKRRCRTAYPDPGESAHGAVAFDARPSELHRARAHDGSSRGSPKVPVVQKAETKVAAAARALGLKL
jgi:hypothetical protein